MLPPPVLPPLLLPPLMLTALTRWLAATPSAFLAPETHVPAVFGDAVFAVNGVLLRREDAERIARACTDARRRTAVSLSAWLMTEQGLSEQLKALGPRATLDVADALVHLTSDVDPARWLLVDERREEAVRTALAAVRLLPDGENELVASDRLLAVSSSARRAAVHAAAAAARRAEEIADALAARRAREAAAQYVPS